MTTAPFLIEVAFEAATLDEHERLRAVLIRACSESSSFDFSGDQESGQFILRSRSEKEIDAGVTLIRNMLDFEVRIGQPQVAYRERLTRKVDIAYTHKKQAHGAGQFAKVEILFEPMDDDAGLSFQSKIVNEAVPIEYIPSIERGLRSVIHSGVLAGFPVVNVKATLVDGAYHDADSSALAFEIAARSACREALQKGNSILVEPIMRLVVRAKHEHVGFVAGDLKSRRGRLQRSEQQNAECVITALAPLSNLFSYESNLATGTQNSASFTMEFSHYAPVDPTVIGPDDGPFAPAMAMRIRAA
jgi:elongation factor G